MSASPQPPNEHVVTRLRDNVIIWLSTVRADGRPSLAAVWYLWENGTILIFSQPNQKIRNVRQNANVSLALDDTDKGADAIVIEGTAELLDAVKLADIPAYTTKYAEQIASLKWTPESMAASYSQAIRITPTRFLVI